MKLCRNYARNPRESKLHQLNVPMVRTSQSKQNLSFRGPVIWNYLPQVVRENDNYALFKNYLKLHINDIIQ